MKLLLYCCKAKPYLYKDRGIKYTLSNNKLVDNAFTKFNPINGKIVAECDFEVEKIYPVCYDYYQEDIFYETENLDYDGLLEKSCLDNQQIDDYLLGDGGYAIYIKNLHIFDKPKELDNYFKYCKRIYENIEKAPQNMCYVYENPFLDERNILISIQPQWLCKILNGEKTIEVRRKVLKGMLKNE